MACLLDGVRRFIIRRRCRGMIMHPPSPTWTGMTDVEFSNLVESVGFQTPLPFLLALLPNVLWDIVIGYIAKDFQQAFQCAVSHHDCYYRSGPVHVEGMDSHLFYGLCNTIQVHTDVEFVDLDVDS